MTIGTRTTLPILLKKECPRHTRHIEGVWYHMSMVNQWINYYVLQKSNAKIPYIIENHLQHRMGDASKLYIVYLRCR